MKGIVGVLIVAIICSSVIISCVNAQPCPSDDFAVVGSSGTTYLEISAQTGDLYACPTGPSNDLTDICSALNSASNAQERCFSGQFVTGFDASNAILCGTPPSNANQFCPNNQYVTGFAGNTLACRPTNANQACPSNQYVTGFTSSNTLTCSAGVTNANQACPSGQFVTGFTSSDIIKCSQVAAASQFSAASLCGSGTFSSNADGSILTLTSDDFNQNAAAYFKAPIDARRGFFIRFDANVYQNYDDTDVGDGFALVVQQDPQGCNALGTYGVGVGYEGIQNAFVVEFDTYYNGGDPPGRHDPNGNHIGIQVSPGVGQSISADHTSSSKFADPIQLPDAVTINPDGKTASTDGTGRFNIVRTISVGFDPLNQEISVAIDGLNLYKRVPSNSIFQTLGLSNALIGFTASTGGASDGVKISNFHLVTPYPA